MHLNGEIALIVMTHGRRDCIEETIKSAIDKLEIRYFANRLIIDDSADKEYAAWLHEKFFPMFRIYTTKETLGFCGSIQRAWNILQMYDPEFIFHLEDDFIIKEKIDLNVMINLLNINAKLAQVALLRQPCNPAEEKAGGVIQCFPGDFKEVSLLEGTWTEHCRFFTTNPSLYPRKIIDIPYPQEDFCEGKFSIKLREMGYRFAYLGKKDQAPKVHHFGGRTGKHWKWV